MEEQIYRYQLALASRVTGVARAQLMQQPGDVIQHNGAVLRKQEQDEIEQRLIDDALFRHQYLQINKKEPPSQRMIKNKQQQMQDEINQAGIARKLLDFRILDEKNQGVKRFPKRFQNMKLGNDEHQLTFDQVNDYADSQQIASTAEHSKRNNQGKTIDESLLSSLRQTFESTKDVSSCCDKTKEGWQILKTQQQDNKAIKVSQGMVIDKPGIDAQRFLQDKKKRNVTIRPQKTHQVGTNKASSSFTPQKLSQLADAAQFVLDQNENFANRSSQVKSYQSQHYQHLTSGSRHNSSSFLPLLQQSAQVRRASLEESPPDLITSPRDHQVYASVSTQQSPLKRRRAEFMTPQLAVADSSKISQAMINAKKASNMALRARKQSQELTAFNQHWLQIHSDQQALLEIIGATEHTPASSQQYKPMSESKFSESNQESISRKRIDKIRRDAKRVNTMTTDQSTMLLEPKVNQNENTSTPLSVKKLRKGKRSTTTLKKASVNDMQQQTGLFKQPQGDHSQLDQQKNSDQVYLPNVFTEIDVEASNQIEVRNSAALNRQSEQNQRSQINQNSYNNQNHILGVPLINKNPGNIAFDCKRQNKSVQDDALQLTLSKEPQQLTNTETTQLSGETNKQMNKLHQQSTRHNKNKAAGAKSPTKAAASVDKSMPTGGMIFRALAPAKGALESTPNQTSSSKKRVVKPPGPAAISSQSRVLAMNQTTQPSSNMRNFSNSIQNSEPGQIQMMKGHYTVEDTSEAKLVPQLGISPNTSPTSRMYKKQMAKSRATDDLTGTLPKNNMTHEPTIAGQPNGPVIKTGQPAHEMSSTLANIKSSYGKDLISALNNNNSSKITAVATGNRQESSESNQNEGGVRDEYIEDPTKQARSRLQEITGKKSITFDDFADYDIDNWCVRNRETGTYPDSLRQDTAGEPRKPSKPADKPFMPTTSMQSKSYSLTEKRKREVDEKDIEEPIIEKKQKFALNSLTLKTKVSERGSHEEQSQSSPLQKRRQLGAKILKPLRIDAQRTSEGGGEVTSAFGGPVSEKGSACSSGMKGFAVGMQAQGVATASDDLNSDYDGEEDLENTDEEEAIFAEPKSSGDDNDLPHGQLSSEPIQPQIEDDITTKDIKEQLAKYKEMNPGLVPNVLQEKQNSHLWNTLGHAPFLSASSWAIYDCRRGRLLAGKRETERREVASITKMMTFYTSILLINEFRLDYNRTYARVSRFSSQIIGTTANLIEGDSLSLKQLFYGMMLPSGNDAAHVLAEFFGQQIVEKRRVNYNKAYADAKNEWDKLMIHSHFCNNNYVKTFLWEMNKNARSLGMLDTFYDSPHGLRNERNFSTTYDVCLLTQECMKIQVFRQVVNTRVFEAKARSNDVSPSTFSEKKQSRYKWETTNRLLGCFEGLIGSKTGITAAAGPCFSGYYEKDDYKLALVLANSRTMEVRWIEIQKMVHWIQRATKNRKAAILREKKKKKGSANDMMRTQNTTIYNRR